MGEIGTVKTSEKRSEFCGANIINNQHPYLLTKPVHHILYEVINVSDFPIVKPQQSLVSIHIVQWFWSNKINRNIFWEGAQLKTRVSYFFQDGHQRHYQILVFRKLFPNQS